MNTRSVGAALYTLLFIFGAYFALTTQMRWAIILCSIISFVCAIGVFAQFMDFDKKSSSET